MESREAWDVVEIEIYICCMNIIRLFCKLHNVINSPAPRWGKVQTSFFHFQIKVRFKNKIKKQDQTRTRAISNFSTLLVFELFLANFCHEYFLW